MGAGGRIRGGPGLETGRGTMGLNTTGAPAPPEPEELPPPEPAPEPFEPAPGQEPPPEPKLPPEPNQTPEPNVDGSLFTAPLG